METSQLSGQLTPMLDQAVLHTWYLGQQLKNIGDNLLPNSSPDYY